MKFAILQNANDNYYERWVDACINQNLDYVIIDIFRDDWLEKVEDESIDCFLLRPPCEIEREKILYDERIYIIAKILNRPTYPSYEEVYIYENKKLLSYYLEANEIPHPKTKVFYLQKEVQNFIATTQFPIVAKTSIGASGSGVQILRSKQDTTVYAKKAFIGSGVKKRFGPNQKTGNPIKWTRKAINDPRFFYNRMSRYIERNKDGQFGYVIFQEYIPHEYEWRGVRIGDSYFAHKKIKRGDKASGTKGVLYVKPPEKFLDFIKFWSDKLNFNSMAFDVFELPDGSFLVNELQTLFGHVQKNIMFVEGKSGRYKYIDKKWVFEEGDYNQIESFDLRLKDAVKILERDSIIAEGITR